MSVCHMKTHAFHMFYSTGYVHGVIKELITPRIIKE